MEKEQFEYCDICKKRFPMKDLSPPLEQPYFKEDLIYWCNECYSIQNLKHIRKLTYELIEEVKKK